MIIKNKKILFITALIILSITMLTVVSNAASFKATTSSTNVKVGDTVTITVDADNAAGMYKVSVDDSSILEISSGSTSEFLENNSKKIVFKAKKAGTAKITASPSDMTDLDDSSQAVTSGSKTFTIKVTDPITDNDKKEDTKKEEQTPITTKTKSSNAYLKTLGVTPSKYDFKGFTKTKTSYNVTVPSSVDFLDVIAKKEDSNATVKISGNSGFEVGSDNIIKIVVTAEDGKTTRTYQIKVTKLAEEEEKPGNIIEEEIKVYLESLKIDGVSISPEFSSDVHTYTANLNSDVQEVQIDAIPNSEKSKVEITGNTDLVDGENLINIIVTGEDKTTKSVYQITLNKKINEVDTENDVKSENTAEVLKIGKKAVTIIIIVITTIIILIIVISILLVSENKRLKKIEEEEILFNNDYNNEIQNLNEIPRTEDKSKKNKRSGKH